MRIIKFTPEELGYKDRGILKWEQKMMLSDHNEALKKLTLEDEAKINIKPKIEMDEQNISNVLYYAFVNKLPVKIQAAVLNKDGNYYRDVNCKIAGQKNPWIYLRLQDGRKAKCKLDMIRNVEFMKISEWYNKL